MPWQAPSLTVKWGPYRTPSPEEQLAGVQAVMAAAGVGAKLFPVKTALEKLRDLGILNADNLQDVLDELDREQKEADAKAEADADRALNDAVAIADATAAAKAKSGGGGTGPKASTK